VTGTVAAPSVIANNEARAGGGIYIAGTTNANGVPTRVEVSGVSFMTNTATSGGGGIAVTLEGSLTITNAIFTSNRTEGDGGSVSASSKSSLTVDNSVFTGNSAAGEGGGVYVATEGSASIAGSTFTGNKATGSGGGLFAGGMGSVEVTRSAFTGNNTMEEGGGIAIDNGGTVLISDSTVRDNASGAGGGGIQNAGRTVNFTRLTITGNTAVGDGGGIESQSTGNFTIEDSNINGNTAENGGGFSNNGDGTLRISRSTFWDNRALAGTSDDTGLGGGIYSLGDAAAEYTNVTISGNLAQVRGGGLYVDADAGVRVVNSTIAFNSSPVASGVGDEGTNLNTPVQPSTSVIFRNTIVASNIGGTNCNYALGSEGGNLENGNSCYFSGPRDRVNATTVGLDAIADNGGPTLTQALLPNSLAVDGGVLPCPATDQRGVARPQNTRCDSGAFEFQGPFAPPDTTPPDTTALGAPVQDTEATSLFSFSGIDDVTPASDLLFECRLLEFDPAEPPEPVDPTQPIPPELDFVACSNPWQVPLIEAGTFSFEVRAIDRAGNVDPTPAFLSFTIEADVIPPETFLLETPPNPGGSTATFTFGATDNATPPQFIEFECRLDSNDPTAWLECANPAVFSNLTPGTHTFQVRATDGGDNIDPTPATYTWTVGTPATCDAANITLFASHDAYVDEGLPLNNFGFFEALLARSAAPGQDARALVRFVIPDGLPDCELESATLRLYSAGDSGRTLEALTVTEAWQENQVTWQNQPATSGAAATTSSGEGYRAWNVTAQVAAMLGGSPNFGWLIRDAAEEDAAGATQSFRSKEAVSDPPTPPQLLLRFVAADTPPPPPPPPPAPGTLICGQVITQSVLLQNDLLNCMGEGLVIGASDIVVDLNGHTISSGMVVDPGEEDGLLAGIRNSGYSNVIIRNGAVRNFGYGVRLFPGAIYNVIENMTLVGNINAGVELFDADNGRNGNIIRNNTFSANGAGVQIINGSENSVVENNTFRGNAGVAIYMYDSSGHRIENNMVSGLTDNPLLDSDGGFYLEGSSNNTIRGNSLSDTGDAAILLTAGSNNNLIEANTATRASDTAISLDDSDGNMVIDNVAHLAGGSGIGLGNANGSVVRGNDVRFNPGGIELAGASGNRIEDNDATFSGAAGISVEGGTDNEIINNVANNTGADGISVEAETLDVNGNPIGGFLITGNTANNNLGDGVSVGGAGHRIGNNTAYNNAAFGIRAAEGNTDDGGNVASGNGEPLQCVGVVCAPGAGAPPNAADIIGPDTTITGQPANGSSTAMPAVFTFTGSDNIAPPTALRFQCRLDAPPDPPPPAPEPGEPPQPPDVDNWLECASPQTYQFLLAGTHKFEVRAVDPADNVDLTPAVYTWTTVSAPPGADATPPETTLVNRPDDPSTSTSASFSFRGSDNATPGPFLAFECALDGAAFTACTSPVDFSSLSLGSHTFAVRAVDLAGNADPSPAQYAWTIESPPPDTTAPETTLNATPEATTVLTDASFSFSSNEAGVSYECALDSAAFAACPSPQTYTSLAVGVHTFAVRAVDAAGNIDATPATYEWEVTPALVPTVVSCGQVLTQNTLVVNELLNCPENGLVIGADKITIDLGGNTIDGTNLGVGILINGFDSVTIRNGTVQEFDYGVQLPPGSERNLVTELNLLGNQDAGISLIDADDNTVRDNELASNGDAIQVLDGSQRNLVRNNDIGGSAGLGLAIVNASENTFEGNMIAGTGDQGIEMLGASNNRLSGNSISGSSDTAFAIEEGSNGNLIEANVVIGSEAGMNVSESHGNQILNNRVSGASDNGVSLDHANNNILRGNDLRFNTGGVQVGNATGNLIEANNVSSITGNGIELGDGAFENTIISNIANDNSADGIVIGSSAAPGEGNLIEGNTANGNDSDGLAISGVGHIILRNEANGNSGWGIYAAAPTLEGFNIDAGGNLAQGNAEPEQCYNIRCDGGAPLPVDVTPPETLLDSAPANPTTRTSATFRFIGFDNGSGVRFECRLDGAAFSACTSPVSYTALSIGVHVFDVRAIDYLGNIDPSPATYTWTIEAPPPGVAPETAIDSAPDTSTSSTTATFAFSSDEEDVTFECALDGGAFTTCASPVSFTGLTAGSHTFAVRAIDGEGFVDLSPATFAWTITAATVNAALSCGQVIVQSTRMTNDLLDCAGNGLVIGANNITLDLNGRIINGINLGVGILNNGFDNVVITNGFVQEFDYGVQLNVGTSQNVVSGLKLQGNQDGGILLVNADQGGAGNTIRNNVIQESINGIALTDGTTGAVVRENTISAIADNGVYVLNSSANRVEANTISETSGAGVALEDADVNTVIGNRLTSNASGGIVIGGDLLPADGNRIEANIIRSSGSAGIIVDGSSQNEIVGNSVREAGSDGISLEASQSNLLLRNEVRANSGGIGLIASSGNRLESNIVIGNSGGIALEALSLNNVIVRNTVTNNSGEGIYVADPAPAAQGNLIEFNTASSNTGGGIYVNAAAHTIRGNIADLNDGWGIYATSGNIDGGGNAATGNAEPAQCFTIVCTIGAAPGAPDTFIVEKPSNPTNSRNVFFTFTGVDNTTPTANLSFECRLDSTSDLAWVECDNPQEYTALAPGQHTFEVRAIDENDLADPTPASYTWTYVALPSGVAPDTFINLAPPAETPLLEALFTFSSNEPNVTYECSLDGAPFTPCAFAAEYEFEEFQVGAHQFRVRAIDFEGNIDPTPAVHNWTIVGLLTTVTNGPAYEPPEAPGEPAAGGETTETSATFTFEANIADSTFVCSLDLGPFLPCTSPVSYTGLAVGDHLFRVNATDPEGREQLEPTEYEWTIIPPLDTVPPDTVITGQPADGSSDVVFTFTGSDNVTSASGLTFECRLDSTLEADFVDCVSPFNLLTEFPEFGAGPHTFDVRAIDAEDNIDPTPASVSWVASADVTVPVLSILSGPVSPTISLEAIVTFAATDNATPAEALTFECALDANPFEPCTSPFDASVEPGEHILQVRAVDLAGNVSIIVSRTWLVIGPPTTFVSGPIATTTSTTATFVFTADQAGSTFECALNSGAFTACASPLTLTDLGGGSYTLAVRATNTYGLVEQEPVLYTWVVDAAADATPPDTSITTAPSGSVASASASFAFASNELNVSFQCQLSRDGVVLMPFTGCETPYVVENLRGGVHAFEVRAVDAAGNIDPTPASAEWTVLGPPLTTLVASPIDPTESTTATFEFTSNVPGSTFACALDGGSFAACTSPVTYTGLVAGAHSFLVFATAPGGYVDTDGAEYEWTIQMIETTLTAAPVAVTLSTEATFTFVANVVGSTFECSLDGSAFIACDSPVTYADLAVGSHSFSVRATSPTGVVDATPSTYNWTIEAPAPPDLTPPQTTILAQPASTTEDTFATFTFSASEVGATFECSLDGQPFAACTSPVELTGLEVGIHTFAVRAIDVAGNIDATPASHNWTVVTPDALIDTAAPDTVITIGPAGLNANVDVVFEFTGSDNVTLPDQLTFECALDGGAWESCDSPETIQGLTYGEHTFAVRAIDAAGNVDATPATRTWTVVDVIAPDTSIDTTPADPTSSTSATFTFSADEAGATYECALDGADYSACTSPVTYNGLAVGAHTFRVRAVDAAGNADTTPDTYTWMVVATAAPDTTITAAPPATTESTEVIFSFASDQPNVTFECALNGAPFTECESPYELSDLAVGSYTLLVRSVNLLDQADPTPASASWTVVAPSPAGNTPAGSNVTVVTEADGAASTATVNFSTVSVAGNTTVSILTSPPALPSGFQIGALTYDVSTTASFSGPTTVCLTYDASAFADPAAVRLLHYEGGGWVDVTSVNNPTAGQVCGVVSSLSPFAVAVPVTAPPPTATLVADTTAPETTITVHPPATTFATSAPFAFMASEEGATFECALDGAPFAACASPLELIGLSVGEHTLSVRAIDAAGNVDPTPATYTWTVVAEPTTEPTAVPPTVEPTATTLPADTTAPETVITGQPAANTSFTSAMFTFSADEAGATFECSVDGAPFAACASPVELTGLSAGSHTFSVRAIDTAGNVDPTPANYTWAIVAEPTAEPTALPPTTVPTTEPTALPPTTAPTTAPTAVPPTATALPPTATALPADTTAPETTITGQPASGMADTSATFTFAANEAGAFFECSLDGAAFVSCASPAAYTGLAIGNHTFLVRAIDAAGNVDATPASVTWTIAPPPDTTPPDTTLTGQPANTTLDTAATFTFIANEFGARFECSLDGSAFTPCASPVSYLGLAVGNHTFAVRAVDAAGNVDPTPASYTWTIQAPLVCTSTTVTVGANADSWIDQNSPTNNKGSDSILKVQSKSPRDNFRALVRFSMPATVPPGCVVQSATLRLFAASARNGRTLQAIPLSSSWTENGVTWNNQPGTTGSAATTTSGTGYRQWDVTAQVRAMYASGANNGFLIRDATENNNGAEQQFHSREKGQNMPQLVLQFAPAAPPADTVPPETTIVNPPATGTADTNATIGFTANEAGATFQCSLDGSAFTACTSPATYTSLAIGGHTFAVRAIDAAGNMDPTPAIVTWMITPPADTTPPDTAFTSQPALVTTDTSATFSFSSSEAGSTFMCSLDGAPFTSCVSPAQWTALAAGSHTLVVQAVDAAGNVDPTPASYMWTIEVVPTATSTAMPTPAPTDTPVATPAPTETQLPTVAPSATPTATPTATPGDITSPETVIDSAPSATTTSTDATFTFSSNESGAVFECSLDNGSFAMCTSPASYGGLAAGVHTFSVRAIDAAGNVDASPAIYTWTVEAAPSPTPTATQVPTATPTPADTTPPETFIDSGPPAATMDTNATLSFSSNEPGTSFQCSLDGAPFAACTSPALLNGLAVGAHTLSVYAIDLAGNADPSPVTYSWVIQAPTPTAVACTPGTITVGIEADAWIDQNSSGNNFGSDSILKVQSKAPRDNFRALVRFAMPASVPQGCVVQSATLRLFAASGSSGRVLEAWQIASGWSESGVTWANQPSTTGVASTTGAANGYLQWNVTSQVNGIFAAGANHGFLIRDAAEGGSGAEQQFHGREKGENPPQLVITFGAP
jgi:parallel beta-helix repeat protein